MDNATITRIANQYRISRNLVQLVAEALEEADSAALTVVDRRGAWYYLSDGSKVQGKANLPEGVK